MILVVLLPVSIALTGLILILSGLAAWLIPVSRRFFLPINLSWLLILMLAFAYYLFSRASFPEELQDVKAYVTLADPALENYYEQHHHYPDKLDQLNLAVRPPNGLRYVRMTNPSPEWDGTFTRHGDELYLIDFSNAEYVGNGNWFVDD